MAPGDLQRLSATFGFCVPVSDLRSPTPSQVLALHLGEYRPFYLKREEDDLAQLRLKEFGLLIMGRPLAGKTRMALEAILAVVPDGILLRFRGREQMTNLSDLWIPTVIVGGKEEKPPLVALFDDLDTFEDASFDSLVDRLTTQVSKLYLVATCRSGSAQRTLLRPALRNLSKGPFSPTRVVEIKPLTPLQAIQVEKEIWKTEPGRDLRVDRSEVGVILGGSRLLERSYAAIPEEGRLILRGLILGECMGSPSPLELVRVIVSEVIQRGPLPSFASTLNALIEGGIVQNDDALRLSFVSELHRNKIFETYYGFLSAFKEDLRAVSAMLVTRKDWLRLQILGLYWSDQLKDSTEARAVLEQSLGIVKHEETLANLAYLLVRSGEYELAEVRLNECLTALSEPDRQARVLIRFGNELLSKAQFVPATQHYMQASKLAQESDTKIATKFRVADTLLLNKEFTTAAAVYQQLLDGVDAGITAAARFILALVGQDRIDDTQHELRAQLRQRDIESKQLLANAILEDAENIFSGDKRLSVLSKLTWEAFRDTSEGGDRADDLLAFASEMLRVGYLSVSKLAYLDLRASSESLHLKPQQLTNLLNNLATTYLYLNDSVKARPLFEEALSLLRSGKQSPDLYYRAAAEDGIAICDIIDGRLTSAKDLYEKMLLAGKSEGNETVQAWAHIGLGRIAWQRGEASIAYDHFLSLRAIPATFENVIRTDLGLARVYLHFRMLDNAEFHIARGTAALVRADYGYVRAEFEELRKELENLKRTARRIPVASSSASTFIDALIMKGGGVKGLAFAGAIRELEGFFQFRSFVGTSAGSIAAVLLAAGATGVTLETELRRKPFRDFLDGKWWKPSTWSLQGLHPGKALTQWIREQLNHYVSNPDVELKNLPHRAVVYASTKGRGEITFDSRGDFAEIEAHFAVRCSISIPFFFQPPELNGRRVFDGGLLRNYPVDIFLTQEKEKQSPTPSFIALYIGSSEPLPLQSKTVVGDVFKIWIDRNDEQVVRQYRDQTVLINTDPIRTIDFDLTDNEKDFLVIEGRAAALEFLDRRGVLDAVRKETLHRTRADAERLREQIQARRRGWYPRQQTVAATVGKPI